MTVFGFVQSKCVSTRNISATIEGISSYDIKKAFDSAYDEEDYNLHYGETGIFDLSRVQKDYITPELYEFRLSKLR